MDNVILTKEKMEMLISLIVYEKISLKQQDQLELAMKQLAEIDPYNPLINEEIVYEYQSK